MRATTTNVGQVLSIGVFFSLMLIGLAATLPRSMENRASRPTCALSRGTSGGEFTTGRELVRGLSRL